MGMIKLELTPGEVDAIIVALNFFGGCDNGFIVDRIQFQCKEVK